MLFHLVLLALIPCLISAEVACPDGKVSCPENQRCCFDAGQYRCCDPIEDEEDLKPGMSSLMTTNTSSSVDGVQNSPWPLDYCPYESGKKLCCTSSTSCYAYSDCCTNSDNCCITGTKCCGGGQWCCYKKQKCGPYFKTCMNAGLAVAPALVATVLVALAVIQSKTYFL